MATSIEDEALPVRGARPTSGVVGLQDDGPGTASLSHRTRGQSRQPATDDDYIRISSHTL
jgi:hypothetical protein